MPSKRPSPIVTVRLLSGGISAEKTSSPSLTLLPVRLRWTTHSFDCQALLDSGAEGNFLDSTFAHKLQIPIKPLAHKISVHALNGHELPTISFTTGPVTLITSGNHTETISFLIMDLSPCTCRSRSPLAHQSQSQNRLAPEIHCGLEQ